MSSIPSDKPVRDVAARRVRRAGLRRDVVELAVAYALVVTGLWMPRGMDTWFYWAALAWVVVTTVPRFPGWTAMGLREKGFLQSLWVVGAALGLAAVGFALGGALHPPNIPVRPGTVAHHYWAYGVWALVQEFLLLDYFLLRLCRVLPGRVWAIGVIALLFGVAHIPNPVLAPLALAWGGIAGVLFLRYRNLYTIGLAHAILGICIAISVPTVMSHHMRVGLGYLKYCPHSRNPVNSTTHNALERG